MESPDLIQIASNSAFRMRVQYAMVRRALTVLGGAPEPTDVRLAQKILRDDEPLAPWALAVVSDPTVAPGTYPLDGATITDAQIANVVTLSWPAFRA